MGEGMDSTAARKGSRKLSGKSVHTLIEGVARLVDGQKRFADEMGLPYTRIFNDGFEAFKNQDANKVILEWLHCSDQGQRNLEFLFSDLMAHQLALVEAISAIQANSPRTERPLVERLQSLLGERNKSTDQHRRHYMEVTAPALVAAYARAREEGSELLP